MCDMFEPNEKPPKRIEYRREPSPEHPAIRYGCIYEEIGAAIEGVVKMAEGKPKKK